jgi:hypothetical protein
MKFISREARGIGWYGVPLHSFDQCPPTSRLARALDWQIGNRQVDMSFLRQITRFFRYEGAVAKHGS